MNSPAPSALRLDYTCAVIAQKQGEEKIPTTNIIIIITHIIIFKHYIYLFKTQTTGNIENPIYRR